MRQKLPLGEIYRLLASGENNHSVDFTGPEHDSLYSYLRALVLYLLFFNDSENMCCNLACLRLYNYA